MRFSKVEQVAIRIAVALAAISIGGCAAIPSAVVAVDSVDRSDLTTVATVSIDPTKPVLLHAVDERFLETLQVSNVLRPVTYVLRPGPHVLWLSEAPAGIPFLPQHINCFVMKVTVVAGSSYHLDLDSKSKLPTIRRAGTAYAEAVGMRVDRAFLLDRGCKWQ